MKLLSRPAVFLLVTAVIAVYEASARVRAATAMNPEADPSAIVSAGHARFTVLNDCLLRMQWGSYHDKPTFIVLNRRLKVPYFTHFVEETGWLVVDTECLTLRYFVFSNVTFNADNLNIQLKDPNVATNTTYRPFPETTDLRGNLLGTIRTLDGEDGWRNLNCLNETDEASHCVLGLISMGGFAVVDDTNGPRFDRNSTWPWLVNYTAPPPDEGTCQAVPADARRMCGGSNAAIREGDCVARGCCYDGKQKPPLQCYYTTTASQDLYFFGHGRKYYAALADFVAISGPIPIPPRFAFGVFYSRFWSYSDTGEMQIVDNYLERNIPLDVLVSDMDWHITFYNESVKDQAGERKGWTGFTWNNNLFPDPKSFLDWCKARGLKNTLNLHPASGVQPWEEKYKEMALAMGIDPASQLYVPFRPSNKTFVENWNRIVLAEREQEGIDFWWLDWQQGEDWISKHSHVPNVNPTFWLNYIFSTNPYHWNQGGQELRPFLLHRFGGLGNHRYVAGFSGDVHVSWESLDYQVYFTIRASNVAFIYWSHDLGGHVGDSPPELFTRWLQFGCFSPIFRTHPSKGANITRRIWRYPLENYRLLRESMLLRAQLVPFIYSAAFLAYSAAIPLMEPLYYKFPTHSESYTYDRQYYFGSAFLVAPVTSPVNNVTGMINKTIFIPPGMHIEWFSGLLLLGPQVITRGYTLAEVPVFVKTPEIIAKCPPPTPSLGKSQHLPSALEFEIFLMGPSNPNVYCDKELYEDDGRTMAYTAGNSSVTRLEVTFKSEVNITAALTGAVGNYSHLVPNRSYSLRFRLMTYPLRVTVDDRDVPYIRYGLLTEDGVAEDSWGYDGETLSLIVNLKTRLATQSFTVTAMLPAPLKWSILGSGFSTLLRRAVEAKQSLDEAKIAEFHTPSIVAASESGRRITYHPETIYQELVNFYGFLDKARQEVSTIKGLPEDLRTRIVQQLTPQNDRLA